MKVIKKMNNAEVVRLSSPKFSLGRPYYSLIFLKNDMRNIEFTNLALLPDTLPTYKVPDVLMRK